MRATGPTVEGRDSAVSSPESSDENHPGPHSHGPVGEFVAEDGGGAELSAPEARRSQLVQLFLFPMLIAGVGVGIFFLFWYLTHERKTFDEYLVGLRSRSETQRYQAAYDLAEQIQREGPEFVGPDGAASLAEFFAGASGEPELRQFLAAALARLADPASVPALVTGLSDETVEVRILSAAALGRIGDARAVDGLVAALGDESQEVRASALAALGAIREKRAVPAVAALLNDRDPIVRAQAAVALAYLGDSSGVHVLLECLDRAALARNERLSGEDDIERTMRSAIEALAELGGGAGTDVVKRLAESDPNLRVRAAAHALVERRRSEPAETPVPK